MSNDRYLRAMRALALLGGVSASTASCASIVVPLSDGQVVDVPGDTRIDAVHVTDTGSCLSTCPTTRPPDGTACAATLSCTYPDPSGAEAYCYCNVTTGATCGTLRCSTAVPGPLPPPEVA
jgi:hypothetical protein